MRILMTGGLGYVGGRLASFLNEQPDKEVSLTTRNKQRPIAHWAESFDLYQMDLRNKDSIDACLNQVKPDTIIHLGVVNLQEACENPELAADVNVKGTERLLDAAVRNGLKRFIYFSTFQVYGQLSGNMTEENKPQTNNPYAQTKYLAEDIVFSYGRKHNVQPLVLRLANAFGYPMSVDVNTWHLVFNSFCKQCIEHKRISIRSDQYRDFITLHDVVRAVDHFLSVEPQQWLDGVFNLGGECCLSVTEVAKKVADIYKQCYGGELITVGEPTRPQDNYLVPFTYSIDKLKSTGFKLTGDMKNEILKTLEICQNFQGERI